MSVDEICEAYARKNVKIALRMVDDHNDMILIEGRSDALEFLGNLLLAHARGTDCGFQIAPNSAGSSLFDHQSTLGLYIHRLPCVDTSPETLPTESESSLQDLKDLDRKRK